MRILGVEFLLSVIFYHTGFKHGDPGANPARPRPSDWFHARSDVADLRDVISGVYRGVPGLRGFTGSVRRLPPPGSHSGPPGRQHGSRTLAQQPGCLGGCNLCLLFLFYHNHRR